MIYINKILAKRGISTGVEVKSRSLFASSIGKCEVIKGSNLMESMSKRAVEIKQNGGYSKRNRKTGEYKWVFPERLLSAGHGTKIEHLNIKKGNGTEVESKTGHIDENIYLNLA